MEPLFLVNPGLGLQPLKLCERTYLIGRSSQTDIVIEDETISRRHALLSVKSDDVSLTDLGSRNGTFVQDERLRADCSVKVAVGQELRFGRVMYVLSAWANPSAADGSESTENCPDEVPPSASIATLSPAQRRVFDLFVQGVAEKCIGRTLHLSAHTVHNHIRAIYRVFQVHSRAELLLRLFHSSLGKSAPRQDARAEQRTLDGQARKTMDDSREK